MKSLHKLNLFELTYIGIKMEEEDKQEPQVTEKDIYLVRHEAARKIQSVFRGYIYRYTQSMLDYQNFAARRIQRVFRFFLSRIKLQRCKEIMALRVITHAVSIYRQQIKCKQKYEKLELFEPVLAFYPAQTKDPEGTKSTLKSTKKKASGQVTSRTTTRDSAKSKKKGKGKKKGGGKSTKVEEEEQGPRPIIIASGASKSTQPPMKRKIIMELPPPWHDTDPRRLSSQAQAELLYAQKGNVAWVRGEIMPMLINACSRQLDDRDELTMKNERFKNRVISKMFIQPLLRNTKSLKTKNPKDVTFIRDTGIFVIASTSSSAFLEISGFSDDNVIYRDYFCLDSPLFDVAICPQNGHIAGLDNQWKLHLFERSHSILELQLEVENPIPKVQKYLFFDHFGFIWVNLFPQKGPLLCIDPVTLQIAYQYNLDAICATHRIMRNINTLIPLHIREHPLGFVAIFNDSTEIMLFSTDFSRFKRLKHNDMTGFPNAKQVNSRLIIYSSDCDIYIYELKEQLEGIQCVAKFSVPSPPVDVAGIVEPDLFLVSCEDCTVRAYLGKPNEYAMRVPNQKLAFSERSFAARLLGPATFTQSRGAFKEMACAKLSGIALHISTYSMTDKFICVITSFAGGSCGSFWLVNDCQPVKACDFDTFNYYEPTRSQIVGVNEYNSEVTHMMKRRAIFVDLLETLDKYNGKSNMGQLRNIFMANPPEFKLTDLIMHISLRCWFSWIPEPPQYHVSSYETFHFLLRSGILPSAVSTFSSFLDRYAPDDQKIALGPGDMVQNQKIPIKTSGLYNTIVDINYNAKDILKIIDIINPLTCLFDNLSRFTISSTREQCQNEAKTTTPRRWISRYERKTLQKKLQALSLLEDTVKHELMRRVQQNLDRDFLKNQLDKMQPVPSIDIHAKTSTKNGVFTSLSSQPNRNPLLDEKRHISIYEVWSHHSLFGKDRTQSIDLRALHIPKSLFSQKQVAQHFDLVRRVTAACKVNTCCEVFSVIDMDNDITEVVMTEDSRALPLSHYLTIHSYLGANARLLMASRSILSKILNLLYQLHKAGIIMRTLWPENVLLNAQNSSVKIGSLWDVQYGKTNYLPLPYHFANPSNPFVPPEYYHDPPSEYTTAFDVWQFGVLLLYVLTGFIPTAYGSELMKYVDKPNDERRDPLSDSHLYPRVNFFYDWLKGCKIVQAGERVVGQRGECYITTEKPNQPASILELDSYKLLPYKNTKLNYDEARLYLEIIGSCLQIDPSKRPTVEQLLRTYPFNQTNQVGDILEIYMRTPNPNVFVSQFFVPVLRSLGDDTFPFTLGIISALIFHEELCEEDGAYAFPLDSRAAERVITALFRMRFMDQIVHYVIARLSNKVTLQDVLPVDKFKDAVLDQLMHFFMRFVASVEHGQGTLLSHVDEVIMSLLSIYAANPYLKCPSAQLLASVSDASKLVTFDSAPLFMCTYNYAHALVRYALQWNSFIYNNLKRTPEHDDNYFDQFLSFSEAVFNFANAICHCIEKQRTNAIKTMASLWQNGASTSIIRLFIDFRVPQKVLLCFHFQGARLEAASFVYQSLNAAKMKCYDPTFLLLRLAVNSPTILSYCAMVFRSTSSTFDAIKPLYIDIIRNILMGESAIDVENLVNSDVIYSIAEIARDTALNKLIVDATTQSSVFLLQLINSSISLQRTLKSNNVDFVPKFDIRVFDDNLDLGESLAALKQLAGNLVVRQYPQQCELVPADPPIDKACDFLMNLMKTALKEADGVAKFMDTQILRATRFEIKESSFMKEKNKRKEVSVAKTESIISELSQVFIYVFKCLCWFWTYTNAKVRTDLIEFISELAMSQIPFCRSISHPANLIHKSIQDMIFFLIRSVPPQSPLYQALTNIDEVWLTILQRDIAFIQYCCEKDLFESQIMGPYLKNRMKRFRMFRTIVSLSNNVDIEPYIKFIVCDMLNNMSQVRLIASASLIGILQFPIRAEAVDMIKYLLGARDKNENAAHKLVDIMVASKFLDKERKITEEDDCQQLVDSSIDLLEMIMNCGNIYDENFMKIASSQLKSLKMRFVREWNNNVIQKVETARHVSHQRSMRMRPQTQAAARVKLTASNKIQKPNIAKGKARAATSMVVKAG